MPLRKPTESEQRLQKQEARLAHLDALLEQEREELDRILSSVVKEVSYLREVVPALARKHKLSGEEIIELLDQHCYYTGIFLQTQRQIEALSDLRHTAKGSRDYYQKQVEGQASGQ